MRNLASFKACLVLLLALSSCSRILRIEPEIYSNIELRPTIQYEGTADKKTIEGLLAELWNSGFLQKSELIKEEIFNNEYGIFHKADKFSTRSRKKGHAYYIKVKGQKEKLMLNRKLFSHYEPSFKGRFIFIPLNKKVKATLIHELFHDFWYNLLDKRTRFLFSIDAEIFCLESLLAKTEEDKTAFLNHMGLVKSDLEDFKPIETLKDQKKYYSDQKFFGTELYSILAERAFSGRMAIPKPLRKFYYGLLSESALNKDRI